MTFFTPATYTHATQEAERILRDGSMFQWSTVTLLAFVFYVYAVEIERGRIDIVLAGLAFWLMDWFNELANSAIWHISDTAPLWAVTGSTSYLILIGLCIEICFMFAIGGIVYAKVLPADRELRLFGLPNRLAIGLGFSIVAVVVEILLHATGFFHWHYWWWNVPFVPLIVVFGYMTFYGIAAWVYDMGANRRRQVRVVGGLAAVDVMVGVALGVVGWL